MPCLSSPWPMCNSNTRLTNTTDDFQRSTKMIKNHGCKTTKHALTSSSICHCCHWNGPFRVSDKFPQLTVPVQSPVCLVHEYIYHIGPAQVGAFPSMWPSALEWLWKPWLKAYGACRIEPTDFECNVHKWQSNCLVLLISVLFKFSNGLIALVKQEVDDLYNMVFWGIHNVCYGFWNNGVFLHLFIFHDTRWV